MCCFFLAEMFYWRGFFFFSPSFFSFLLISFCFFCFFPPKMSVLLWHSAVSVSSRIPLTPFQITPVWTLNCLLAGINTWMSWQQLFNFRIFSVFHNFLVISNRLCKNCPFNLPPNNHNDSPLSFDKDKRCCKISHYSSS